MNYLNKIIRKLSHHIIKRLIVKNEQTYKDGVKYLFIPHKSNSLLVVFSGFTGESRKYNYVSSFYKLNINQLYILDSWGYKGSYYWMENGDTFPECLVDDLIKEIIKNNNISTLITCGSSKGGTAAIYFGLNNNAQFIYSGSCQFLVGTYLNRVEHIKILEGMIGTLDKEKMIAELDRKVQTAICNHRDSSALRLFYSTEELTYNKHIIPLKNCLEQYNMAYEEKIESFKNHSDVGTYFPSYVCEELEKIL